MVVGFNHNFRHKGEIFHVQTEDGGLKNPQIVTLLYKAGTILASKKISYADIIKVDNLSLVVEELMKDQHREMLRRLKNGEFDGVIAQRAQLPPSLPGPATPSPSGNRPAAPAIVPEPLPTVAAAEPVARKVALPVENLDDIILSYLTGKDG